MFTKKILVDLDGVLNEYGKEPYDENNIPKIKTGAKEFVQELSMLGDLYLFTSRNLMLSAKWLIENNIDKYFDNVTSTKPLASIYLDDRALKFEGNYDKTLNNIKNYKVYWKN